MQLEEFGSNKHLRYIQQKNSLKVTKQHTRSSLGKLFRDVFLPEGYPASVSKDYLQYQIWDTLQALCSSVTGVLSTRAILAGVGVGNENASLSSATIQWVIRDGTGMIGRIIFAWKQDVLNDIGMILEMISPLFPDYFLPIACAGTISKSITGVAGGCTRAALTQHFARRDNLGDVSAKDGSQETAVGLMGMLLGMVVTAMLSNDTGNVGKETWLLFSLFTILHLFCNYKGISAVQLETFNRQRADIFLQQFLMTGSILTPTEVSKLEKVIWFDNARSITLGAQIQDIVGTNADLLQNFVKKYDFQHDGKYLLAATDSRIFVVLRQDVQPKDILVAYLQAAYAKHLKKTRPSVTNEELGDKSHQFITKHFGKLAKDGGLKEKLIAKGWVVNRCFLGPTDWRVSFVK